MSIQSESESRPVPRVTEGGRTRQQLENDECKQKLADLVKQLGRGIVATFGDLCEVVLHDFSDPEHSIIWIEGNVTGRKLGGSVTEIGLAAIRGGDAQQDLIGYVRNTKDGKVLRSSTILLRDLNGHVFGAMCVNMDITDFVDLRGTLNRLIPNANSTPRSVHFTDRIDEVLGRVLEEAIAENQRLPARMNREDRLALIASLDRKGAFQIQRGVPAVAAYLGVSRTTIYTYLEEVRSRGLQDPKRSTSGEQNDGLEEWG